MYLHIGNGETVKKKNIIGIFDMDTATVSSISRKFLSHAEKEKKIVYGDKDIPRTFLLCEEKKGKERIILSKISSLGLKARILSDFDWETNTEK